MSVEELHKAVCRAFTVHARWPDGGVKTASFTEALDRLILEVQAEMPCCCAWFYEEVTQHWSENWYIPMQCDEVNYTCPSCTARQKLREAVPS